MTHLFHCTLTLLLDCVTQKGRDLTCFVTFVLFRKVYEYMLIQKNTEECEKLYNERIRDSMSRLYIVTLLI